jgi:hypothetical protein
MSRPVIIFTLNLQDAIKTRVGWLAAKLDEFRLGVVRRDIVLD